MVPISRAVLGVRAEVARLQLGEGPADRALPALLPEFAADMPDITLERVQEPIPASFAFVCHTCSRDDREP
jgi:hypothetical protein